MEISTHVRQRWQWAVDSLRLFFWRNPIFTKSLSWRQKLSYASFGYNYLVFGLAYPIFFMIPVWGLFTDRFFLNTGVMEFIIWRAPYALAYLILNRLLTDKRHDIKTFRAQIGLFQAYISAILTALFSRRHMPRYKVNPKLAGHPALLERIHHVLGHLLIIGLSASAIIYGWITGDHAANHFYMNSAWALWVIWLLATFVVLSLKSPPNLELR
jgi:cellulose synthase (UDP-forming)